MLFAICKKAMIFLYLFQDLFRIFVYPFTILFLSFVIFSNLSFIYIYIYIYILVW